MFLYKESVFHMTLSECVCVVQVLGRRVQGLSEGLESAAVQCSMQRDTVQGMKEQLTEIQNFVEV